MSQLLLFYKSFQQSRTPAAKAAPTFEDLSINDDLTEHERVVRYVKSSIGLQRLVHVKMLGDVAMSIGFKSTVETLIPLLDALSKDSEQVVRQHLAEQLKILSKFVVESGGDEGYQLLIEKLIPIVAFLLEDDKAEVRQSASATLIDIAHLVKEEDIGQYILTIILRLAHEDDKEEMRMTASQLLNLLAELLGPDLCKQFVIPEVVSLSEDPTFRVRKSTALNFHNICKVGGEHELLERLMPAFVRLSKDEMYRVRRACAESLPDISKNVNDDIRIGVLVEIFLRLTHDPSKLVRQTVLQQSGLFISTLPSRAVNENVLSYYTSLISSPTGDLTVDAELRHICAYSFPGVLNVIGPEKWEEVRELYHELVQSRSTNVKQTLSHSLHEVARILNNEELVELELVPVFEEMIQDVEVVQVGIIKHLARFLEKLPQLCRQSYLPLLNDILHTTNPFNWRLRQYIALQLPDLIDLPPKGDVFKILYPTIMVLLQDPVAYVRKDTYKGVAKFINILHQLVRNTDGVEESEEPIRTRHLEEVINAINSFVDSDKFQIRQLWIELCKQLLKDISIDLFENHFLEGILQLALDPVSNVRICLSNFFVGWEPEFPAPWIEKSNLSSELEVQWDPLYSSQYTSPWQWLLSRSDIKQCIFRLSVDDNDICLNLSKLAPFYKDIEFSSISCRGRKFPPGGISPITINSDLAPQYEKKGNTIVKADLSNSTSENINSNEKSRIPEVKTRSRSSSKSSTGIAPVDVSAVGLEFINSPANSLNDFEAKIPTVLSDELDIIDGIIKSPSKSPEEAPQAFQPEIGFPVKRSNIFEEDDEEDEIEELNESKDLKDSQETTEYNQTEVNSRPELAQQNQLILSSEDIPRVDDVEKISSVATEIINEVIDKVDNPESSM